jgi:hypothetical protein
MGHRRRPELVGENAKQRDAEKDGGRNRWWESMGNTLEKREGVIHFDKERKERS